MAPNWVMAANAAIRVATTNPLLPHLLSRRAFTCGAAAAAVLAATASAYAEPLAGAPLIAALREGGYVLVMRHASSPTVPPDKATADRENTALERQLDENGRNTARAMGKALRALHIPIHEVLSSPTYRALQTVRLAALPEPRTIPELGDGGQSMAPLQASPAAWLRNIVSQSPPPGTDRLIVTHAPNITGAFGANVADVADGETLVFRPMGNGEAVLAGRIKIQDWPALAKPR
jgi:phosphohistidine phosphatase SixA